MPNTVYKINDQDPLYNTSKLTLHSNNLYGKIYAHLCINRNETSCGRREKNTHEIVIHLHTPVQMMEKTEKKNKKEMLTLIRHTDVKNRLWDLVGEGKCGMIGERE